jgi:hypothetical protein
MKRTTLAYATALALLSVLALAAPASAAPGLLSAAEIDKVFAASAARLPSPGTPEWSARMAAQQTEQTFTLSAGKGRAAAAVICLASSEVLRSDTSDFFIAVGEASSSCPAPVDYLGAQARLWFWVPDLGRWELAQTGSLAYDQPYAMPGKVVTSVASSTCRAAYFAVVGFHQARLGGDTASVTTEGNIMQFTCG